MEDGIATCSPREQTNLSWVATKLFQRILKATGLPIQNINITSIVSDILRRPRRWKQVDDNAKIHRALIIQNWFREHDDSSCHMNCPPQSPDLNLIEVSGLYWNTGYVVVRFFHRQFSVPVTNCCKYG
ncbi:hypothetical protein AVEN_42138-1 [Araneus ventricosus]|uniref:Tc1-like transposase DDE domain-containing protein n=1 Tax=Araneus ventricosus TaxID=182803 RepID=A0A4Y2D4H4_ARAVE|nr:hypothetical protein AVEN_42138-1 [Araneus ventricosus]